jgi:hypothetical protein
MTTATTTTWEPPATIARDDLVRRSEAVLARPDIPFTVRESIIRINVAGLDWDIGAEIFEPADPASVIRDPLGRKVGLFNLHGGAGDHRNRRTSASLLASKFGFKVVAMTFPGRLNLRDPNRDWPGETIHPDGTVRTPLYVADEVIGPDQYELVTDKSGPKQWGTLFFAKAKEGSRFYERMAAWPIAFEEAMIAMCREHLPADDGWVILSHGHSTGGPFAHQTLQRVENVIGLAALETSQWCAVGATGGAGTGIRWPYPFNYLVLRTWRHIARYMGPENGLEGANRLPSLIEEVFEAWDKAKMYPQFKAEYFVTHGAMEALAEGARFTAARLGMSDVKTAALVKRYHDLTRPLEGPGVKPVPPLLYIITQGSVDHTLERYQNVLLPGLARVNPPPKARVTLLEAGIHGYEKPEDGLPRGVFPAGARLWEEALQNGYYTETP